MYTFRFNPIFEQWVLLGEPIPTSLIIQDAHKILPVLKQAPDFQAATYPRQPFLLDPITTKAHAEDLLYAPQPPVGEYELILYTGDTGFFAWTKNEWEGWLLIVAERFCHMHLNPYLHFLSLSLSTRALLTAGEHYQRVGDLIATSHAVAGTANPVERNFIEKLTQKERLFVVAHDQHGSLYVPTAPLHHHELWYLPTSEAHFDALPRAERETLGRWLSHVFLLLHDEFPEEHWQLKVHTPMAGTDGAGWWIQIYQESLQESPLPIQPLPERFTFLMRHLLAHQANR